MTGPDLKPCPFCGGPAELVNRQHFFIPCVMIYCRDCRIASAPVLIGWPILKADGKPSEIRHTMDEAINICVEKWNARTSTVKISSE